MSLISTSILTNIENSPGVSATINVVRRSLAGASGAAPETLVFDLTYSGFDATGPTGGDTYDDRLHEIDVVWDFYETGSGAYVYNSDVDLYRGSTLHANGHANARYAYGSPNAHTYQSDGTRTVKAYLYERSSGKFATARLEVTVGDADSYFPTTNTVFLSPSGSFGSAPSGAVEVTSGNLTSAINTYAKGASNPVRIMLNTGESYTCSGANIQVSSDVLPEAVHIVGLGSGGTRPTIAWTGSFFYHITDAAFDNGITDILFSNLIINGTMDTAANTTDQGTEFFYSLDRKPHSVTLDRCALAGFEFVYEAGAPAGSGDLPLWVMNDTTFIDKNKGMLLSDHFGVVMTGSSIKTQLDAYTETGGVSGWGIRADSDDAVHIIHSSEFYNNQYNSFSSIGGSPITHALQSCLRLNQDGGTDVRNNIQCSVFEGGGSLISLLHANGGTNEASNGLFQKNYLKGSYATQNFVNAAVGGWTFESNVFITPTTQGRENLGDFSNFIVYGNYDTVSTESRAAPILIRGNTFVNLLTTALGSATAPNLSNINAVFTGEVIENNIIYQPSIPTPQTSDAPLGDDTNQFDLLCTGWRDASGDGDQRANTETDQTAGNSDFYDPETGSGAIGDATSGSMPVRDFFGQAGHDVLDALTRSVRSRGAIEVSLES